MDDAIAENVALVQAGREADLPVVFTRHVYRDGMIDASARAKAGVPAGVTPLLRGSWDAALVDALPVEDVDVIIDKNRYDAFLFTDLEATLKSMDVDRLLVGGVITHMCVESTVRSAEQRGYDVLLAEDATLGPSPAHEASLAAMNGLFATVGPWRDLLARGHQDRPCRLIALCGSRAGHLRHTYADWKPPA